MIGEVITQERAREDRRNDARAKLAEEHRREALIVQQERDRRREQTLDNSAQSVVGERVSEFNRLTGQRLFEGYGVSGETLSLTVDGNVWEYLSHQDQDILKRRWPDVWLEVYCGARGHKNCAGKWLTVDFYDLAKNHLDHENFQVAT
jgi:hypothetical protein